MLKRVLHIVLAFLLIATTSSSVWGQYILENDGVEISEQFEKDAEKNEKELEDTFDDWEGSHESPDFNVQLFSGFIKNGSSTFTPSTLSPPKLYILLHRIKVAC